MICVAVSKSGRDCQHPWAIPWPTRLRQRERPRRPFGKEVMRSTPSVSRSDARRMGITVSGEGRLKKGGNKR
jgi:hypothetical protein